MQTRFHHRQQRGAFSVLTAFTLSMLMLFLVLVLDSGRLYLDQRTLQKLADTAALESISRLANGRCGSAPENAQLFAEENARRNQFLLEPTTQSLTVQCVRIVRQDGLRQAIADPDGAAVEVLVSHRVATSFVRRLGRLADRDLPEDIALQAVAVAERDEPTAAFSIGSQLIRLNNNRLLAGVLRGVGVNVGALTILDSAGLANAWVTPAGLLQQLGVEIDINQLKVLSPQGLVDLVQTQVGLVGLDQLVDVSLELVSDSVLNAELGALRQSILGNPVLRDIDLQLFGTTDQPGLISLISSIDSSVGSALDAQIPLGDLIGAALLTGTGQRGLMIPGLDVLGGAQVELGIVEPPSIGIGPVGTKAYNAQIRLYVGVDSNQLLSGALTGLTSLVNLRVNLPVWIDLVSGDATLDSIRCDQDVPVADILVETDILNACIGAMPDDLKWSTGQSCETALQEDTLISLLNLRAYDKVHLPALRHDELLTDMQAGETLSTQVNPLALGDSVSDLTNSLLDLLGGLFRAPNQGVNYTGQNPEAQINSLARQYLEATKVNGLYNVANATDLVLNGRYTDGHLDLVPLVDGDWALPRSIPTSCLVVVCPQSQWQDGTFVSAFQAYVQPQGLLDLLGISTLSNGYRACGGLLSALLAWNSCIEHNLAKFLRDKPGGINLSAISDGNNLANPGNTTVSCASFLCRLLQPVLQLLKPLLNGIGELLNQTLNNLLGVELGRNDVTVHSLSCGAPRLVR